MTRQGSGGDGGHATVEGDDSTAEGGQGGHAVVGSGGRGGDASVHGDNAHAIGGRGGCGGIGPGAAGGDARIVRDQKQILELLQQDGIAEPDGRGGSAFALAPDGPGSVTVAGGQGGEASQPDGRGGRGGRAYIPADMCRLLGVPDRGLMRWPYFEPVTEPGRGGDAADTPQYMARRLILENLKRGYFSARGLPLTEVWWDRSIVPMDWLNEQLRTNGHRWAASIVDDEYEFSDRL